MVSQKRAATLHRRRNPNESRRNRNKKRVRGKYPRNDPNKGHLLGQKIQRRIIGATDTSEPVRIHRGRHCADCAAHSCSPVLHAKAR
jgi:hypothetical protein